MDKKNFPLNRIRESFSPNSKKWEVTMCYKTDLLNYLSYSYCARLILVNMDCSGYFWVVLHRTIHFSFLMISKIICSLGEEDFSFFIIDYVPCLQNITFYWQYFQYFLNLWKDLINLVSNLYFHKAARFSWRKY